MSHRTFTMTMPADNNYHCLYDMLAGLNGETAITGAIPTDGILPDRVRELFVQMDPANAANTINISDSNHANSAGAAYAGGDAFQKKASRNVICLRDYFLKGNNLDLTVDLEFT